MKRNDYLNNKVSGRFLASTLVALLAANLSGIVNPVIAGNVIGPEAVAALHLYHPVLELWNALTLFFVMGANLIAAYAIGQNQRREAGSHFLVSVTSVSAVTLLASVLCFVFRSSLTDVLCTGEEEIFDLMRDYVSCILWDTMPKAVYFTFALFVAMDGHPEKAAKAAMVSVVVNISSTLLLTKVMGVGIAGMALGSIIADIVGALMLVPYIMSGDCSFRPAGLDAPYSSYLKENLKKGVAHLNHELSFMLALFIMNEAVLRAAGTSGAVVWGVSYSLISIALLFYKATSETMMSLGVSLTGEKDGRGLLSLMLRSRRFLMVSVLALLLLVMIFPSAALHVYGVSDPVLVRASRLPLILSSSLMIVFAFEMIEVNNFDVLEMEHHCLAYALIVNLIPALVLILFATVFRSVFWLAFVVVLGCELVVLFFMRRSVSRVLDRMSGSFVSYETSMDYDYSSISREIQNIKEFLLAQEVPDATILTIEHSIDELAYNIIKHRPASLEGKSFDIRVVKGSGSIDVFFKDAGRPFNPVIDFDDDALTASENGKKMQLALRMFNMFASRPHYRYSHGLNVTRMSFDSAA